MNWQKIVDKILSARFIMVILFTLTYCLIEIACALLLWKKIISTEVFIAQLATFAIIVKDMASSYFKRKDRTNENNGQPK